MTKKETSTKDNPDRIVFFLSTILSVIGIVVFSLLQYTAPRALELARDEDLNGILLFSRHLGIPYRSSGPESYISTFSLLLIVLAGLNLGGAIAALNVHIKYTQVVFSVIAATNIFVAIVCPPAQSRDIFNYIALAREYAWYGLNPYTHPTSALIALHDSSVPYLQRDVWVTSPYGPCWTILSICVITCLHSMGLFLQAVSLKLIEGAALVGASVAARRFAMRRDPRFGLAAMVAVGLNPLCLLEGPGNGHNDAVMMFIFMAGLCLYDERKYSKSAFMAGLATAMKFVPLAIAPWIFIDEVFVARRINARWIVPGIAIIVSPTALLLIPFWEHGAALGGLLGRLQGASGPLISHMTTTKIAASSQSLPSKLLEVVATKSGSIILYGLITLLLILRRSLLCIPRIRDITALIAKPGTYPAWLVGWIVLATLEGFTVNIKAFWVSWYCIWSIFPAACIWTRRGNLLLICAIIAGLADALKYTQFPR